MSDVSKEKMAGGIARSRRRSGAALVISLSLPSEVWSGWENKLQLPSLGLMSFSVWRSRMMHTLHFELKNTWGDVIRYGSVVQLEVIRIHMCGCVVRCNTDAVVNSRARHSEVSPRAFLLRKIQKLFLNFKQRSRSVKRVSATWILKREITGCTAYSCDVFSKVKLQHTTCTHLHTYKVGATEARPSCEQGIVWLWSIVWLCYWNVQQFVK